MIIFEIISIIVVNAQGRYFGVGRVCIGKNSFKNALFGQLKYKRRVDVLKL